MSDWYAKHTKKDLADRIEQLERELEQYKESAQHILISDENLRDQLAAEKALSDEYSDALADIAVMGFSDDPAIAANIARIAVETARKARGL